MNPRPAERNTIRVKEFAELHLLCGLQGNELVKAPGRLLEVNPSRYSRRIHINYMERFSKLNK